MVAAGRRFEASEHYPFSVAPRDRPLRGSSPAATSGAPSGSLITLHMRDWFLKNFWLKLTSAVLATLIWLTVQANLEKETRQVYQNEETADEYVRHARIPRRIEVLVDIRWDGTNCPGFQAIPRHVVMTIEGEQARMNGIGPKDLIAFVETGGPLDLGGLHPVQALTLSPHMQVVNLLPQSVRIKADPARNESR